MFHCVLAEAQALEGHAMQLEWVAAYGVAAGWAERRGSKLRGLARALQPQLHLGVGASPFSAAGLEAPRVDCLENKGVCISAPRIELGTFCVLDRCDNHYTTVTRYCSFSHPSCRVLPNVFAAKRGSSALSARSAS